MRGEAVVCTTDDQQDVIGVVRWSNPMRETPDVDDLPVNAALITWSGSMSDDLNEADPRNFMRVGHEAFQERCVALRDALVAADRMMVFVPSPRHILSDAPGTRAFQERWSNGPFGILIDPWHLITEDMQDRREEHLERIVELAGPQAWGMRIDPAADPASRSQMLQLWATHRRSHAVTVEGSVAGLPG